MAESANVTWHFGELDAHKKFLSLLERMKLVLGEDMYEARLQELLLSMPSPTSFVDKMCSHLY
jgi:hypothetical protein